VDSYGANFISLFLRKLVARTCQQASWNNMETQYIEWGFACSREKCQNFYFWINKWVMRTCRLSSVEGLRDCLSCNLFERQMSVKFSLGRLFFWKLFEYFENLFFLYFFQKKIRLLNLKTSIFHFNPTQPISPTLRSLKLISLLPQLIINFIL
jgi:hypothetical protein